MFWEKIGKIDFVLQPKNQIFAENAEIFLRFSVKTA